MVTWAFDIVSFPSGQPSRFPVGYRALVIVVPALEDIHGDAQFFCLAMVNWWVSLNDEEYKLDQY